MQALGTGPPQGLACPGKWSGEGAVRKEQGRRITKPSTDASPHAALARVSGFLCARVQVLEGLTKMLGQAIRVFIGEKGQDAYEPCATTGMWPAELAAPIAWVS